MPVIRTDLIDIYLFRRTAATDNAVAGNVEFLQLRRCAGALAGSWQTIMGHAHAGETAVQTALRELREETAFAPPVLLNMWQLEELNTFFLASHDAIVMSPCFAAEVAPGSEPTLNDEHDALRWVKRDHAEGCFVWPGQRQAIAGICRDILAADAPMREALRIPL
jgi:8-oxo-dGTP pyrophosphatase MutT (NUDIX family)